MNDHPLVSAAMKLAGALCLGDLTGLGLKWRKAPLPVRQVATPVYVDDMIARDPG